MHDQHFHICLQGENVTQVMRTQTNTAFLYTNVSFQEDLLELEVLRVQVFPEDPGALFSSMTESSHCHPGTPPGGGTFLHTLNETTMI